MLGKEPFTMKAVLFTLTLTLVWIHTHAEQQHPDFNQCLSATRCGDCIALTATCVWCQKRSYSSDRCDTLDNHVRNGCENDTDLVDPSNEVYILQNENVRDAEDFNRAIQVEPQRIAVKVRPNKPVHVELKFRQASNYPVDLYLLMDLSMSMQDDKDKVSKLAHTLVTAMREMTNNVRFGFGSFVDKVALPFTSTEPSRLEQPCDGCSPPYSFRHMLSLTEDADVFVRSVQTGAISGNLDSPEGGLDAMLQVAVCPEAIGWREVSRKLLVYSSDAPFHSAGDGKLAGIVAPNDGQCHLDPTGNYTAGTDMDYPSVGQIQEVIRERKINVIFAVTEANLKFYNSLSRFVPGSTTGVLNRDSENIVDLVMENYARITSRVQLEAENAEGLKIQYRSRCRGSRLEVNNKCEGLRLGEEVTFDVEIQVSECPEDLALRRREVVIRPVGLIDRLTIEMEVTCECDCQKIDQAEPASDKCSGGKGTYACGVCECDEGRYGRLCECAGDQLAQDSSCQPQNSSMLCSGQGECVCGECTCFPRMPNSVEKFSGKFCQCDDYSCDLHNGMFCGGPERGRCRCGTCQCHNDFIGTACECPIAVGSCLSSNGVICNGYGACVCGECKCDEESRCHGEFCENCPQVFYLPCVSCKYEHLFISDSTGVMKSVCSFGSAHTSMVGGSLSMTFSAAVVFSRQWKSLYESPQRGYILESCLLPCLLFQTFIFQSCPTKRYKVATGLQGT